MQELGALSAVLGAVRVADSGLFAIELAVAASRVDALSLASWLPMLFAENSSSAVTAVVSFLHRKLESQGGLRTSVPLERTSLEQLAAVRILCLSVSLSFALFPSPAAAVVHYTLRAMHGSEQGVCKVCWVCAWFPSTVCICHCAEGVYLCKNEHQYRNGLPWYSVTGSVSVGAHPTRTIPLDK